MNDKLLTAKQVADLFGISLRTLETLIKTGEAPAYIWIGRQRRWRAKDVTVFLDGKAAGQ